MHITLINFTLRQLLSLLLELVGLDAGGVCRSMSLLVLLGSQVMVPEGMSECVCVCVCVCWGRDQFKERRVREVEIGTQLPNSENAQCNHGPGMVPPCA